VHKIVAFACASERLIYRGQAVIHQYFGDPLHCRFGLLHATLKRCELDADLAYIAVNFLKARFHLVHAIFHAAHAFAEAIDQLGDECQVYVRHAISRLAPIST
jgi:hypothetical protein